MPGVRRDHPAAAGCAGLSAKLVSGKGPQTYYIGTLVVFARDDGSFEVIDGQQRFTTLSLLANWLKHHAIDSVDMSWYQTINLAFESRPISSHTFERLWQGVAPTICGEYLQ